jgi:hypothetical protein
MLEVINRNLELCGNFIDVQELALLGYFEVAWK